MANERRFLPAAEAQRPLFVGIDLGGTNVKCGVVDDQGRVLSFHTIPTAAQAGPEDGARRIGAAVLKVIELAKLTPADIARLGLGAPGTQDIQTGLLLDPPNLPGWINFPLRDRVSQYSGISASFGNDASAATFGEFWIGSGREAGSIVMFTLGTGIGSGIIVEGHSIDGQHSTGSECGHIIIDCNETARMCQCGRRGHLEAYCGANAVIKRTREALDTGAATSLQGRLAGEKLTPLVICEEAERGDALCERIILDTARYLAVGVTNLMHIIDPDMILIGGAMTWGGHGTAIGRRFLDTVRQEVRRLAFPIPAELTKIDYASLGGDAGFIGAAGLARLAHGRLARSCSTAAVDERRGG